MNEELTKEQLIQVKALVNNFPKFLAYVFSCIGLPAPTPMQLRIATKLGDPKNDKMVIEAPRGLGKSYITGVYVVWLLLRNPKEQILIVSATKGKAIEVAIFVRGLFNSVPILKHLDPKRSSRDSITSFDVFRGEGATQQQSASVSIVGISGAKTGKRATVVIADDIEIPDNSQTEEMRANILRRTNEFPMLKVPGIPQKIIALGTPQTQESIYNKLPSVYKTFIYPAEVPTKPEIYGEKLDPWVLSRGEGGALTDDLRYSKNELLTQIASIGASEFRLHYLLDTTLADIEKYPLKLKDLICMPLNSDEAPTNVSYAGSPEYTIKELQNFGFTGDGFRKPMWVSDKYDKYDIKIMAVDPSGKGSDQTAYAIIGVLNGYVYLLDIGGTNKGFEDEALIFLAQKAKQFKVNAIVAEQNWGDGMFTKLLKLTLSKVYPCMMYDSRSSGQKEKRILNVLEPLIGSHKLIVNYAIADKLSSRASREMTDEESKHSPSDSVYYNFFHQFTHLTRDRGSLVHDDQIDALAIGVEYIKNMVQVDATDIEERLKKEEYDKWMAEIISDFEGDSNVNFYDI